ncbi:MAG: DNA repair protein RecO [Alphaproteobacteria bacterium]|nr:DNA repair protein RecO [Alphaproteobacteria bacterium]
MIEWHDSAILLNSTRYGEYGLRLELFCEKHGKQAGFIKYQKSRPQIGNIYQLRWRARLIEQLGQLRLIPQQEIFAHIAYDSNRLLLMQSLTHILARGLADADSHQTLYHKSVALLHLLISDNDPILLLAHYIMWEKDFLFHSGAGLDFSICALTGARKNLRYVSPHTGKAITAAAANGQKWRNKLLPIPSFLQDDSILAAPPSQQDLAEGFALTGYFLNKYCLSIGIRKLPEIRQKILSSLPLNNMPQKEYQHLS